MRKTIGQKAQESDGAAERDLFGNANKGEFLPTMKLPMWARVVAVVLLTCGAALLILPLGDGRIGELGDPSSWPRD